MDFFAAISQFLLVSGTVFGALIGGNCIYVGFRNLKSGAAKAFHIFLIILGVILIVFFAGFGIAYL